MLLNISHKCCVLHCQEVYCMFKEISFPEHEYFWKSLIQHRKNEVSEIIENKNDICKLVINYAL